MRESETVAIKDCPTRFMSTPKICLNSFFEPVAWARRRKYVSASDGT